MPLIATRGAASAQGFGEFAEATAVNYIENVFSTYLYTGNGSTQTITNGIDLAGKGGLVWIKGRSGATDHALYDTTRGATFDLASNTTAGQTTQANGLTSFGTTGLSVGALAKINTSTATYASWTFREQPKFFDVVTWTGTGANRTIAHNLGSVPGCIIVKRTDTAAAWAVYHRSLANTQYLVLNDTAAVATDATRWNSTTPTSTVFSLGTATTVNASGGTYVAYIYAHDAGGFGLTGTDNVISCGSFTTNGSGAATINLGWEPQFVILKRTNGGSVWSIVDSMRAWVNTAGGYDAIVSAEFSGAEFTNSRGFPTATGFEFTSTDSGIGASLPFIYIAIRRGPMKVPTLGTSVFSPILATFNGTTVTNTGFVVDMVINKNNVAFVGDNFLLDRLRGSGNASDQRTLSTNTTSAEVLSSGRVAFNGSGGASITIQNGFLGQNTTANNIVWAFRRAPGFFDEVCYTGNDVNGRVLSHNLTVKPELVILKTRNSVQSWATLYDFTGTSGAPNGRVYLNSTDVNFGGGLITAANASTITLTAGFNSTPNTYVSYLFATLAGVSKVGSYTGTAALQTVACGFTSGARFVLIKRTDAVGGWYVWDSARGITSGNDPYLLLNTTAAEVTGTNYVDTDTTGFKVTAAAPAGINASGGNYIFLAIA